MSRRFVDQVGIGDVIPTAALEVAPRNADEVGLKLHGSFKGTQTANLMECYNSANTLVGYITPAGLFYVTSEVSPGLSATAITATNAQIANAIVPGLSASAISATIAQVTSAIVPGLSATSITATNLEVRGLVNMMTSGGSNVLTFERGVEEVTSTAATVASAISFSVADSAVVTFHAIINAYCTSGMAAGMSGSGYILQGTAQGGTNKTQLIGAVSVTPAGTAESSWTPGIQVAAGANMASITVVGSAGNIINWTVAYDLLKRLNT